MRVRERERERERERGGGERERPKRPSMPTSNQLNTKRIIGGPGGKSPLRIAKP